jgi:hypothetical protein
MKIIKYLSLVLAVALTVSCEKHVIEYDATPIGDVAEFQLHYMNPVAAVAANYITRVEVNGKMVSNSKATLNTYNAIPSGSVGKFYTVNPGSVNLKLYLTGKVTVDSLVYDQSVTMKTGKQNVFVHDFTQPLIWFDNGYPYIKRETVTTDSTAWVKFYNFLYDTQGVPTTKLIQYQYVNSRTNALVNIGEPLAFGEATGWEQVAVIKASTLDVSRLITFKMKEVDANGNIVGELQVMNSSGTYINYSGTATLYIGRWYHHIMAGFRAVKSPNASVRVFTAL